jgi:hypothetical protein
MTMTMTIPAGQSTMTMTLVSRPFVTLHPPPRTVGNLILHDHP